MELVNQQMIRAGNLKQIYHLIDQNLSISGQSWPKSQS